MARPDFPWVFRYEEEGRAQGASFLRKALLRPVVIVRLEGERLGSHNLAALVDSGSDHVVAAPWVAQDIGVVPDESRAIMLQIGGAPRSVRFADVTIHLCPPSTRLAQGGFNKAETYEWQAQVGFFTEWQAPPWNVVLGQVGFFDQFTVTLNRESQALAITELGDFDRRYRQPPSDAPGPPPRFLP